MKLINSVGPNPHVVRMFAAEKGVTLDLEEVDLMAGANRQQQARRVGARRNRVPLELKSFGG